MSELIIPEDPTLDPEIPTVEIHKPKPVHSWREFLKEYCGGPSKQKAMVTHERPML
jgi:hypothetical protein